MPKAKSTNIFETPNPDLEAAIQAALTQLKGNDIPLDIKAKILTVAITWEKVKHAIKLKEGENDGYDPDED